MLKCSVIQGENMVKFIDNPYEKEKIASLVLNSLPDWFGLFCRCFSYCCGFLSSVFCVDFRFHLVYINPFFGL